MPRGGATVAVSAADDADGVLERAERALAGGGCELLRCRVEGLRADRAAVEVLAHLALLARRHGCELRLLGASPELVALLELIGLDEALGARP